MTHTGGTGGLRHVSLRRQGRYCCAIHTSVRLNTGNTLEEVTVRKQLLCLQVYREGHNGACRWDRIFLRASLSLGRRSKRRFKR